MPAYTLSLLIFIPMAGAFLLLALPRKVESAYKWLTLCCMGIQCLLAFMLYLSYSDAPSATQGYSQDALLLSEHFRWFYLELSDKRWFQVAYFLGIDGLSLPMVLLSGIVMLLGAIASFEITKHQRAYYALFLLLSGSVMGCFMAMDFFLFFLFFEFMLLPMYFLIGIWGGKRREYASVKFFIYTFLGSVFILIVMIGLYLSVNDPTAADGLIVHSFNFFHLSDAANFRSGSLLSPDSASLWLGLPARTVACLLLFLGFAIKLPSVPLHTWLPDAHVEAPTPVSVVLAGILLKIGGYGLFRIAIPIFPEAMQAMAWWIGLLGVVSMLYGALVALGQQNLKKMIAYASVSHMGFVMLGIASFTSEGFSGAIYQMFSHGILSAMLFLVAGVLYTRTNNLEIASYRGLTSIMPRYAAFAGLAFFASLGLPGFSAFIGELLVFLGSFQAVLIPQWMSLLGLVALLVGAAYFVWVLQRIFWGEFSLSDPAWKAQLSDLSTRESIQLIIPAILAILFGIVPHLLLQVSNPFVNGLLQHLPAIHP